MLKKDNIRRKPIILANWDCQRESSDEVRLLYKTWRDTPFDPEKVEPIACYSSVHSAFWLSKLEDLPLKLCAQNVSPGDIPSYQSGRVAWTAARLRSMGTKWVALGHNITGPPLTDEELVCRFQKALEYDLKVILYTHEVGPGDELESRLAACIPKINKWGDVALALQPRGGSTEKNAELDHVVTEGQAEEMHQRLRKALGKIIGAQEADHVRILYAGNVFPANCMRLVEKVDIDGVVVNSAGIKLLFMKCVQGVQNALRIRNSGGEVINARDATKRDLKKRLRAKQERKYEVARDIYGEVEKVEINLYSNSKKVNIEKLVDYWGMCTHAKGMIVTTSCFEMWKLGSKVNDAGKVIPAIPPHFEMDNMPVRVFFLDDNLGLPRGGAQDQRGICNLRNLSTGEFVDFRDGHNGFVQENVSRHTSIVASSEYRNVLVQVNILDAVADENYFTSIIERYSQPPEKLFVVFDVNGTIVWNDTISQKGSDEVLLNQLFKLSEVRLPSTSTLEFRGRKVELKQKAVLKDVVSELFASEISGSRTTVSIKDVPKDRKKKGSASLTKSQAVAGAGEKKDEDGSEDSEDEADEKQAQAAEGAENSSNPTQRRPSASTRRTSQVRRRASIELDVDEGDIVKVTDFWTAEVCESFLRVLHEKGGEFFWLMSGQTWSFESFRTMFKQYQEELNRAISVDGIPMSWFKIFDQLHKQGHTVVLNSFGVDTHRVVMRSVPDERLVQHIVINFDMWAKRDLDAWLRQFNK